MLTVVFKVLSESTGELVICSRCLSQGLRQGYHGGMTSSPRVDVQYRGSFKVKLPHATLRHGS